MTALHELDVSQSVQAIQRRELSAVELTRALIERIDATDERLRAWVVVDRERALDEAGQRDAVPAERRGPMHGVPLGVKDIFDVAGLPTRAGFAPFADQVAAEDCTAVARLRQAGAVILGKTVTTQFAYMDPPPTRNPWSAERTPGGSSSGSGASVAARQVLAALGSQTGGSVLRPAAYNGIVGVKPTFGRISRWGVLPLAWSIDHPGTLTRSVVDAALLLRTIAGRDPRDPSSSARPVPDYVAAARPGVAPRLLVLEDFLARTQPDAAARFEEAVKQLAADGARVERVRVPSGAAALIGAHAVVMQAETAAVHRRLIAEHAEHYAPRIRGFVENGALIPAVDYLDAQRLRRRLRREIDGLLAGGDVLALPTVSGPAPAPDTTGDASFQGPFSLLGLPAISLPSGLSAEGLPLGVQLVAPAFGESALLGAAAWCERAIEPIGPPPGWS